MRAEGNPPFLCTYRYKGSEYCCLIGGDTWAEAEEHLKSIGANGTIVGSDTSTYSANAVTLPFVHVWVHFITWWRNLWWRA